MYCHNHGDSPRTPLDFNTPRRTDSVADSLGPDTGPHNESPVPTLDPSALLTELGLSDRTIREALTESPGPGS